MSKFTSYLGKMTQTPNLWNHSRGIVTKVASITTKDYRADTPAVVWSTQVQKRDRSHRAGTPAVVWSTQVQKKDSSHRAGTPAVVRSAQVEERPAATELALQLLAVNTGTEERQQPQSWHSSCWGVNTGGRETGGHRTGTPAAGGSTQVGERDRQVGVEQFSSQDTISWTRSN